MNSLESDSRDGYSVLDISPHVAVAMETDWLSKFTQGEIQFIWVGQQCLCFAACFLVGKWLDMGSGARVPLNPDPQLGDRVNVMLLFSLVSHALYHMMSLRQQMNSARNTVMFHGVSWCVAMGFPFFQNFFKGVTLSVASMKQWSISVWCLGCVLMAFLLSTCVVRCRLFPIPRWRRRMMWVYLAVSLSILFLLATNKSLHLHHWQIGLVLAVFFSLPEGSNRPAWSVLQAFGLGLFVNGVAVFGFGGLFEDLPACNSA